MQGRCQRTDPPCKYLHPPQHLKEQLLQNGRNNLIMRNLNQLQRIQPLPPTAALYSFVRTHHMIITDEVAYISRMLFLGRPTYSWFLSSFFFSSATLRARWTELRNSTKTGHVLGSECDLKMYVRNLGYTIYPPPTNRGPKTTFFDDFAT